MRGNANKACLFSFGPFSPKLLRQTLTPNSYAKLLRQTLTPNTSCREIVRRVQAWRAGADSETDSSHKTVAYCKARAKLPEKTLAKISKHIADRCERNTPENAFFLFPKQKNDFILANVVFG